MISKEWDDAITGGDLDQISQLLNNGKPRPNILACAVVNGTHDCVRLIAAHNWRHGHYVSAILKAVELGKAQCVEILAAHIDLKRNNSSVLRWAVFQYQHECVDILFPLSDPKDALNYMQNTHGMDDQRLRYLKDKIQEDEALKQKTLLNTCITRNNAAKRTSKI